MRAGIQPGLQILSTVEYQSDILIALNVFFGDLMVFPSISLLIIS